MGIISAIDANGLACYIIPNGKRSFKLKTGHKDSASRY